MDSGTLFKIIAVNTVYVQIIAICFYLCFTQCPIFLNSRISQKTDFTEHVPMLDEATSYFAIAK